MFGTVRAIFKERKIIMGKVITEAEKDFNFAVTLCDGYKADGTYTVKAASESEAQEKALTEICDKLYRALPELDIEVSVELLEDSEMEDNQ